MGKPYFIVIDEEVPEISADVWEWLLSRPRPMLSPSMDGRIERIVPKEAFPCDDETG